MLDRIVDLYTEAMVAASNSGHESIVRLLLDKGSNAYNEAMCTASCNGQVLMLDRGANNYNGAMTEAASQGHHS